MPANATIIGRVAVKVLPDTGNFRKELQRELDAIEKRVEIKIPAVLDATALKRSVLESVQKINAEIRDKDAYKVKLSTTLDVSTTRMREQINKVVRKYEELSKTNKVKLATELDASKVKVKLDDESLKKTKQDLDHWNRQVSPAEVSVHTDLDGILARGTSLKLSFLTRDRIVKILPKVDNAALAAAATTLAALSGARALGNVLDDLWGSLKNLDKSAPIIGTIALAVAGLAGWGATAAANLFALSASLAQIAGAGLALPGILGGIAVGLTVTIVALKDFKKYVPEVSQAWKTLKKTISENFWAKAAQPIRDMVDGLLPEFVGGFKTASVAIGGYFGALATSLKTSFKGPVKAMFDNLTASTTIATASTGALANIITKLGTAGSAQLPRLAVFFNKVTTQFSNFLTKAAKDGSLQRWIDNGIEALKTLGHVFIDIGHIFSGLSKAMTKAGGSTLTMFEKTLSSIAKTVNSAGFQHGLIDFLTGAFQAMHNIATVAGPAVKKMFTSLADTFSLILPEVGIAIGQIVKAIATLFANDSVNAGLQALFDGISNFVDTITPVIASMGPVIGDVLTLLADFLTQLGPVFAAALQGLAPIFRDMVAAVQPLIDKLMPAFATLITNLAPLLQGIVEAVLPALVGLFKQLAGPLRDMANTIMPPLWKLFVAFGKAAASVAETALPVLLDVVKKLVPPIADLVRSLLPVFVDLLDRLAPIVEDLATGIADFIKPIAKTLGPALSKVIPPLTALIGLFAGFAADILPVIGDALARIMPPLSDFLAAFISLYKSALQPVVDALTPIVKELLPPIADLIGAILRVLTPLLPVLMLVFPELRLLAIILPILNPLFQLLAWVLGLVADALNLLAKAIDWCIGKLKEFGQFLQDFFSGPGWAALQTAFGIAAEMMKRLWGAAWDWLKTKAQDVWTGIQSIVSGIGPWLASKFGGAIEGVKAIWGAGWNWLKTKVSDAWSGIQSIVGGFQGWLGSKISGAMNTVKTLWTNGWNALINPLKTMWTNAVAATVDGIGNVIHFIRGIPDLVVTAIGDLGHALWDAGVKLITGFIGGIKSKIGGIKNVLGSITSSLTDWKGPPKTDATILIPAGQLVIGGFVKGIESAIPDVRKSLQGLTANLPEWKGPASLDSKILFKSGQLVIDGLNAGLRSKFGDVRKNLTSLTKEIGAHEFEGPMVSLGARVDAVASRALATGSAQSTSNSKTLNYYAAPGSSLSSEEDLFAAAGRARMAW